MKDELLDYFPVLIGLLAFLFFSLMVIMVIHSTTQNTLPHQECLDKGGVLMRNDRNDFYCVKVIK